MSFDKIKIEPLEVRNTTSNNYLSNLKPIPVPDKKYSAAPKEAGFKGMMAKAWETTKDAYTNFQKNKSNKKSKAYEERKNKFVKDYDYNQSMVDMGKGEEVTDFYRDSKGGGRMYYKTQEDLDNRENHSYIHAEPSYVEGERSFKDRFKSLNTKLRNYMPEQDKLSEEQKKAYLLSNQGANPMSQEPFQDQNQFKASNYKAGQMRGLLGKASDQGFFSKETRSF